MKPSLEGIRLALTESKRKEWLQKLRDAKGTGILTTGEASKMAGRLGFTTQTCFYRIGRAMATHSSMRH